MSYAAKLSETATSDLHSMPPALREYTLSQLAMLEQDPKLISERSRFPFPKACQVFLFDKEIDGDLFLVNVLFNFELQEKFIHIASISWQTDIDSWGP